MFSHLTLIILLCGFLDEGDTTTTPRYNVDYLKSWTQFENFTSSVITSVASDLDYHLQIVLDRNLQISVECSTSLVKWTQSLKSLDPTAVKQLDSWGRLPSGLMSGGWIDHGGFDECLALDDSQYCLLMAHLPLMEEHPIEGFGRPYNPTYFNFSTNLFQSLVNYVHFFRYMNITSALCLPKGCSAHELTLIANQTANHYLTTGLIINVDLCQNRYEHVQVTWGQLVSLTLIVIMVIVTLIGTFWSAPGTFLHHFNFKVNWIKLFTPVTVNGISENNNGDGNDNLQQQIGSTLVYLNGIKAITMLILIFIHLAFTILPTNFKTSFTMYDLTRQSTINIFFIGGYMTDTFFLITGLEATWSLLGRTHNQSGRTSLASSFNLGSYLLLRWLRFAPSIVWTIAFSILLFSRHSQNLIGGPLWGHKRAAGSISASCEDNWFYHVLFIAHFFDTADDFGYCLLSDWYLESDYLYHLAFIPIIYFALKGKPKASMVYSICMIVLGSSITCLIIELHGTHHSWLTTTFPNRAFFKYLTSIHGKPWSHLSSYFMGVMAVFCLINIKPQFNRITRNIIWFIWSILWLTLFSYDYVINTRSTPIGFGISLLFAGTSKLIWSLIIIWFIYALHYNLVSPAIIKSFLSCQFFTILARISLSVLLVNLILMMVRNATYQTPTYMVMGEKIFSLAIPMYVTVYTVALIFSVLIESPARNIIKSIIQSRVHVHSPEYNKNNNSNVHNELATLKCNNDDDDK